MIGNSFDDLFANIESSYEDIKNKTIALQNKIDSWNKDKEIQKYKAESEYIMKHSLIQLTDKELSEDKNFRQYHYRKCGANSFIYKLGGTGIGIVIEISCPVCNTSKDITEEWK